MPHHPSETLQEIREKILRSLTNVIILVGGLTVVIASIEHIMIGSYVAPAVYVAMYLSVLATALQKSLRYPIRAGVALALVLGCAISEYVFFGMTGLSYIAMYSFVVFTGLFFGLRYGLAAMVLSVVLMGGQFMLTEVRNGAETSLFEYFMGWFSPTVAYCFLVSTVLIAASLMLRRLEESNISARSLVAELQREVAEHKGTGNALKASEERYRLLAENAQDVIWTSDLAGHVTYVSPSVTRVTGYTPEEYTSIQFGKGWDVEYVQNAGRAIQDQLKRDKNKAPSPDHRPFIIFAQKRHKDGSLIDLEISCTFIRDSNGKPNGILGVTRDVRDRKRLERQLYQSQKMEAVGQLAGGISHDFNNLLQVIHGYSEMALDDAGSTPEVREKLQHVLGASDRARDLVSQLLAFSRQQTLNLEHLDLGEVVGSLSAMIDRLIGAGIEVRREIAPGLDKVYADRGQVEQVVLNLCVNARDAMGAEAVLTLGVASEGFSEADAREKPWSSPGNYTVITVADNGTGMDEATQERIFDPFYTTKAQGKGTGLGLSTVFGIVKQHNGFIHVESALGAGTAIRVYLPVVSESRPAQESEAAHKPEGGSETILFVDDEPAVRDIGDSMLTRAGYTVLLAENGLDALKLMDEQGDSNDLVMLDVVMPKLGGRAVAEEIAQRDHPIPVMFMSGYTGDSGLDDLRLDHTEYFIQKPYNRDTLLRKVRHCLDVHRATASKSESV